MCGYNRLSPPPRRGPTVDRCHGLEGPASPEGPVVSFIYLFSFIAFLTF